MKRARRIQEERRLKGNESKTDVKEDENGQLQKYRESRLYLQTEDRFIKKDFKNGSLGPGMAQQAKVHAYQP